MKKILLSLLLITTCSYAYADTPLGVYKSNGVAIESVKSNGSTSYSYPSFNFKAQGLIFSEDTSYLVFCIGTYYMYNTTFKCYSGPHKRDEELEKIKDKKERN